MKEIMEFCKCKDCKDNTKCNRVDLMNCYTEKKLTIKNAELKVKKE